MTGTSLTYVGNIIIVTGTMTTRAVMTGAAVTSSAVSQVASWL